MLKFILNLYSRLDSWGKLGHWQHLQWHFKLASNSADSLKRLSITDQVKAPFSCGRLAHTPQLSSHLVHREGECVFDADGRHSRRPVDSIRDAVLTVSPNRQYRGMVRPTTPATTGPAKHSGRSSDTQERRLGTATPLLERHNMNYLSNPLSVDSRPELDTLS